MNSETNTHEREAFIRGLRELADFYEHNEAIPLPWSTRVSCGLSYDKELRREQLRAMGNFSKEFHGTLFYATRNFGSITLELCQQRTEVCVRKVVGTKVIPSRVIPAQPEQVIPEQIEEIVEWDCQPVLGGAQ